MTHFLIWLPFQKEHFSWLTWYLFVVSCSFVLCSPLWTLCDSSRRPMDNRWNQIKRRKMECVKQSVIQPPHLVYLQYHRNSQQIYHGCLIQVENLVGAVRHQRYLLWHSYTFALNSEAHGLFAHIRKKLFIYLFLTCGHTFQARNLNYSFESGCISII